jgi:hypothetical protein
MKNIITTTPRRVYGILLWAGTPIAVLIPLLAAEFWSPFLSSLIIVFVLLLSWFIENFGCPVCHCALGQRDCGEWFPVLRGFATPRIMLPRYCPKCYTNLSEPCYIRQCFTISRQRNGIRDRNSIRKIVLSMGFWFAAFLMTGIGMELLAPKAIILQLRAIEITMFAAVSVYIVLRYYVR